MGSWAYFDPEYETLSIRINPPQVSVDNSSCKECTLVKVDSMNKPGILLEVVQILTDLDLIITKAYISSDGGWFMDVFHVTDQQGQKISNSKTIECIEKGLSLELCAKDRIGLLSEVTRVIRENGLSVTRAGVTTVGEEAMNVFYVTNASGNPVDGKIIEELRKEIGETMRLNVKKAPINNTEELETSGWAKTSFFFGSLLEKFKP